MRRLGIAIVVVICALLLSCEESSRQADEKATRQSNPQEPTRQADSQERSPLLVYARSELPEGQKDNAEAIGSNLISVDRDWQPRSITDDYRSYSPSISPDGSRIAFARARPGSARFGPGYFETSFIHVMDTDGSRERRLTRTPDDYEPSSSEDMRTENEPEFSPDGEKVAFLREAVRYPGGEGPGENTDSIRVIDADGGESVRLASRRYSPSGLTSGGYGPPTFSPDGQRVAFIDMSEDTAWAVDVESGEREQMFTAGDLGLGSIGSDIEWSPGGDELLIQGSREPAGDSAAGASVIGIVEPDGAVGPRFRELLLGAGPMWTQDGEHVLVNRRDGLTRSRPNPMEA